MAIETLKWQDSENNGKGREPENLRSKPSIFETLHEKTTKKALCS